MVYGNIHVYVLLWDVSLYGRNLIYNRKFSLELRVEIWLSMPKLAEKSYWQNDEEKLEIKNHNWRGGGNPIKSSTIKSLNDVFYE